VASAFCQEVAALASSDAAACLCRYVLPLPFLAIIGLAAWRRELKVVWNGRATGDDPQVRAWGLDSVVCRDDIGERG
jgi:hypothetical protein